MNGTTVKKGNKNPIRPVENIAITTKGLQERKDY